MVILICFSSTVLRGQCSGDIRILTQVEVDAFAAATGGCSTYTGDIIIHAADSLDLSSIQGIKRLEGVLTLYSTQSVAGIFPVSGFADLTYVEEFRPFFDGTVVQGFPMLRKVHLYDVWYKLPPSVDTVNRAVYQYLSLTQSAGLSVKPVYVQHSIGFRTSDLQDLSSAAGFTFADSVSVGLHETDIEGSTAALKLPAAVRSYSFVNSSSLGDHEMFAATTYLGSLSTNGAKCSNWDGFRSLQFLGYIHMQSVRVFLDQPLVQLNLSSLTDVGSIYINGDVIKDMTFMTNVPELNTGYLEIHSDSITSLEGLQHWIFGKGEKGSIYGSTSTLEVDTAEVCTFLSQFKHPQQIGLGFGNAGFSPEGILGACLTRQDTYAVVHTYRDMDCNGLLGRPPTKDESSVDENFNSKSHWSTSNPLFDDWGLFFNDAGNYYSYLMNFETDTVFLEPWNQILHSAPSPAFATVALPLGASDTIRFGYCPVPPLDSAVVEVRGSSRGSLPISGRSALQMVRVNNFSNQSGDMYLSSEFEALPAGASVVSGLGRDLDSVYQQYVRHNLQEFEVELEVQPNDFVEGATMAQCINSRIERDTITRFTARTCRSSKVYVFEGPNELQVQLHFSRGRTLLYTAVIDNNVSAEVSTVVVTDTLDSIFDPSTVEIVEMDPNFTFTQSGNVLQWSASSLEQPHYGDSLLNPAGLVIAYAVEHFPQRGGGLADVSNQLTIELDSFSLRSTVATIQLVSGVTAVLPAQFQVYPNPASDYLVVEVEELSLPLPYKIFSSGGALLGGGIITDRLTRIPLTFPLAEAYLLVELAGTARIIQLAR